MSRGVRWSERWFQRALWLVAVLFALFLNGLGGLIVNDLPRAGGTLTREQFIDPQVLARIRAAQQSQQDALQSDSDALQQSRLQFKVAQSNTAAAMQTFSNWLATRHATAQAAQDPELIRRTRELDALKASELAARQRTLTLEQQVLQLNQAMDASRHELGRLQDAAEVRLLAARRHRELVVFLYRLVLLLPLLLLAAWLFARKRGSLYWPFVWGFIFFALFAFFVELVPYLPSYGGYVRYLVGILLTVMIGVYAIRALQRYLERQRTQEQMPDPQRREQLSYDLVLTRLAKKVCPGCERTIDPGATGNNFCEHCGIGLFDICGQCHTRKSAFVHFCPGCGAPAQSVVR
jgi:hypothetical protein